MFGWIQTSQTWGQPYSDISPYGECCVLRVMLHYDIALTANTIDYTKIPGFDHFAPGFGMNINKAKINI